MMLHLVRVFTTVGLLALHGASADASSSEAGLRGATCENQLDKLKAELQQAQQMKVAAPLQLDEAPSDTHWPSDRQAYVPPLVQYWFELHQWLQINNHQWAVAAVAGVLGLINLVNGPTSFKTMLMLIFSLVASASTYYEVKLLWPQLDFVLQAIIVAEAALLTGFVAYHSTEGCQAFLGLLLGLGVSVALEPLFHTETWQLNQAVVWYSAWAIFGVLSLTVFQKRTLAFFSPCLGGFLLSSCLGYEIKLVAWASSQQPGNELPGWLVIHGDCWLDFARTLLPNSPVSAGVFEVIPTPGFPFKEIDVDRVLGRLLWFVLFYAGLRWQMFCARKSKEAFNKDLKESLLAKKKKPMC
eukprot:gnl/MRDRNA2_/MRDRNA2_29556_c0_seq1.p1 gnl/MRDRNA2_/MRDRNA2_29556_c0~~gnl/MRDRNA2_/MRDRNA2_29556_c0_seq1.p1  ORF type:complete len:355 (+),score=63.67 gnl/MRDRNA2_/MRDRNA2_29556_c0_seq1:52-1116(+)